jgi:hypothetical protein
MWRLRIYKLFVIVVLFSCQKDITKIDLKNSLKREFSKVDTCNSFFDFSKIKKTNSLVSEKGSGQVSFKCNIDSRKTKYLNADYKNIKIYIDGEKYMLFALGIDGDEVYTGNYDKLDNFTTDLFFSFSSTNEEPISFQSNTFPFTDLKYKVHFENGNQKVVVIQLNYKMHGKKPKWEIKELHFIKNCGLIKIVVKNNEDHLNYTS